MWLRILTGDLAGQTFELRPGDNIVGRGSDCDVVIACEGISKRHACVSVHDRETLITDLKSSNGTYVNGIRIIKRNATPDDKIGFYNILCDLRSTPTRTAAGPTNKTNLQSGPAHHFSVSPMSGNQALQTLNQPDIPSHQIPVSNSLFEKFKKYIDDVAMPGVYQLVESFEYSHVIGAMIATFILAMACFSIIPMMTLTKDSVEKESRRRALTIARNLAAVNLSFLQQGIDTAVSVRPAEREEGVQVSMIISNRDGHVIAPALNLGEYPDLPFVHKARKIHEELVEQIDAELIGASVPISIYSPELGQQIVAHAVVLYNMGNLAIDSERFIGLFTQILAVSLLFGYALYFILLKLFEKPLKDIGELLEAGLRNEATHLESKLRIPVMSQIMTNINSLIFKTNQQAQFQSAVPVDQVSEAIRTVQMMSQAACALDKDRIFIAVNAAFEDLIGMRQLTLSGQSIEILQDQSFKMCLSDLIDQNQNNSDLICSFKIDFSGKPHEIDLSSIRSPLGVAYYLVGIKVGTEDL